jgi:hypothetical protein
MWYKRGKNFKGGHMKKTMEAITIRTAEKEIVIEQEDTSSNEPNIIGISPDQVDVIVKWLQEAKAELEKKTA